MSTGYDLIPTVQCSQERKEVLGAVTGQACFPFQRRNRVKNRNIVYLLILSLVCLREGVQPTTTDNFQVVSALVGSLYDL